ncbi:MAG: glycosyltransferase family 2 protein, partial [Candidatus Helarchaeota archaeon]
MENNFDISIIIINYNTGKLLRDCLTSVFNNVKNLNYEVLVIDNNSFDKSLEIAEREILKVKVIRNKENLGFAGANNQGIKMAKGRYIFLLNPDTVILDEKLKKLIEFMDSHPEAGACGPLVLSSDNSIQRQCKRGFPTFWTSFS